MFLAKMLILDRNVIHQSEDTEFGASRQVMNLSEVESLIVEIKEDHILTH